jgi:hypothetical protein
MEGLSRRGFIRGLGALLATTAIVPPPPIEIEAVTNNVIPGSAEEMYWLGPNRMLVLVSQNLWRDLHEFSDPTWPMERPFLSDPLGLYQGISIRSDPQNDA